MSEKRIEGIGIFSEDGRFAFSAGLAAVENALGNILPSVCKGVMTTKKHGEASFVPEPPRAIMAPQVDEVLRDNNLVVKRTSRNFIVTMKFPIIEGEKTTISCHKEMWAKTKKAIENTRESIKSQF